MTEQKYSIKTLTPQQRTLLNEIRKETEAPYRNLESMVVNRSQLIFELLRNR